MKNPFKTSSDSTNMVADALKTCVGGYTCPQCGRFVQMNIPHSCYPLPCTETISSGDLITVVSLEPQLPSLQSLMEQIGLAGHSVFIRYDCCRKSKHWTVMITDMQGRRDTDKPVETLLKMWKELLGE